MSVIASVKHRTASSHVSGACWEFTPIKGCDGPTLIARLVLGSRVYDIEVPVCGNTRQVPGRWIVRPLRSREAWMLDCWVPFPPARIPQLRPFIDGMIVGSVELLACPPDVAEDLDTL